MQEGPSSTLAPDVVSLTLLRFLCARHAYVDTAHPGSYMSQTLAMLCPYVELVGCSRDASGWSRFTSLPGLALSALIAQPWNDDSLGLLLRALCVGALLKVWDDGGAAANSADSSALLGVVLQRLADPALAASYACQLEAMQQAAGRQLMTLQELEHQALFDRCRRLFELIKVAKEDGEVGRGPSGVGRSEQGGGGWRAAGAPPACTAGCGGFACVAQR